MSLRKRLPFAMLLAVLVLAGPGLYRAQSGLPNAWRSPAPAAALPWHGSAPANQPDQRRKTGLLLPASFLPVQFKNPKDLGVGKLLVAGRGLGDPRFAQTVVLLVHYDADGVIGLILNRRTGFPLSQVLNLKAAKDRTDPVYIGGPVQPGAVFALFQSPAKIENAENVFGSVYWISDKSVFDKTLSARPDPSVFHVYLGYAGWTQDQLRAEVQMGAWFVFPADPAPVFSSDPGSLWPQMIQKTELQYALTDPLLKIPRPAELSF